MRSVSKSDMGSNSAAGLLCSGAAKGSNGAWEVIGDGAAFVVGAAVQGSLDDAAGAAAASDESPNKSKAESNDGDGVFLDGLGAGGDSLSDEGCAHGSCATGFALGGGAEVFVAVQGSLPNPLVVADGGAEKGSNEFCEDVAGAAQGSCEDEGAAHGSFGAAVVGEGVCAVFTFSSVVSAMAALSFNAISRRSLSLMACFCAASASSLLIARATWLKKENRKSTTSVKWCCDFDIVVQKITPILFLVFNSTTICKTPVF